MPKSRGRRRTKAVASSPASQQSEAKSSAFPIALFALAIAGNLLNVAGITDDLIKWRDFFRDGLLIPYQHLRAAFFSVLPFEIPEAFHDLIVSCIFILGLQGALWGLTPLQRRSEFIRALGPYAAFYAIMTFGFIPIATAHVLDAFTKRPFIEMRESHGFFSFENVAILGVIQLTLIGVTMWHAEASAQGRNKEVIRRQQRDMLRAYLVFVAAFLALLLLAADLPRLFSV